ncbi:PREDICTED: uncharacterized protein LOC104823337 [Tarenaya hassleriana]|uniref:uncharacterized protein LOC104823337 n=1 Tax=Tarenaya hassleriana TaxID=28532 RepID=UPI00053C770B|nr:PREDICTED: uncharacterized protein LOC104823337 [Tarenaya hassleriana]
MQTKGHMVQLCCPMRPPTVFHSRRTSVQKAFNFLERVPNLVVNDNSPLPGGCGFETQKQEVSESLRVFREALPREQRLKGWAGLGCWFGIVADNVKAEIRGPTAVGI